MPHQVELSRTPPPDGQTAAASALRPAAPVPLTRQIGFAWRAEAARVRQRSQPADLSSIAFEPTLVQCNGFRSKVV